ncbi:MAG: AraC family transcriptional regulator [Citrobacter freundii]|nr:MAG: AraC family transcriptional regulator [Citrobacter freundii]
MVRRLLHHSFILLNVDYVSLGDRWNYKNVISPYYRMYYIDAGEGSISNGKKSWVLEPGYIYLIPSFTICDLHCSSYLSQYFIHFFEEARDGISLFHYNRNIFKIEATDLDIANFKRIYEINPYRKINRSDNPKVYEKNVYYQEYEELNNKQSNKSFLETQGIMLQLVSKFLDEEQSQFGNVHDVPSKIIDLLGFIQLNLDKPLTVKMLADKVNLHSDYLSRIFLKLTGERPLAYIHTKRIERAQYLIVTTDLSLTQIAEDTGFSSLPHFSKVFRVVTSLTPGKYREQNNMVDEDRGVEEKQT